MPPPANYERATLQIVTGRAAILPLLPELEQAATAWDQQFQAADLAYFLVKPSSLPVMPVLVLLRWESTLIAAVSLHTWSGPLRPLRLFSSADRRGRRTVFAPQADRVQVAAIAARALYQAGARFINLDFDLGPHDPHPDATQLQKDLALTSLRLRNCGAEFALSRGMKRFDLPLAATFDATLSTLGKRTRRNLRYYQRLCLRDLGSTFDPSASVSLEALRELNAHSTHRDFRHIVGWRHASLKRFANTALATLHDRSGLLLSVLATRRNGGSVEIDWQMNRRGYERFSLATAIRAFLIEHEVQLGSTSLSAEGGTTHTMADSFRERSVMNLALRRPSFILRVFTALLGRFLPGKTVTIALHRPWRAWIGTR